MKAVIKIEYCPKCGWLTRSSWMAQELLNTFVEDIQGVMLTPSENGGTFLIKINEEVLFDRKQMDRFPEIKELKRLVRDKINPHKNLGHTDR